MNTHTAIIAALLLAAVAHIAAAAEGSTMDMQRRDPLSDMDNEDAWVLNAHAAPADLVQEFSEWKATHNKQYESAAEEGRRFAVYQEAKKRVDEHNAKFAKGEVSFSMGLNAFSDLTAEEMKQRHTGLRPKRDVDAAAVQQWAEWKAKHNKQYETPAEEARRFALFQETKKQVEEHNAKFAKGEVSYSLGLNAFADMTPEEVKQHHTGFRPKRAVQNVDALAIKQWAEWKAKHNKQYETPAEEGRRFAVFQDNKKRVDEHNEKFAKGEVSYSMGLNAFSDLTTEEFKQRNGHGARVQEDDASKALKQQWTEWKAEHNKQYENPAEEARRFALFKETKKQVDEHNAKFAKGEVTYSMGLNAFADMTAEEVKQRHTGLRPKREVDAVVVQQWAEWKAKHNKQYETPAEEARRFALFQENKKRVDEHNEKFAKGEVTYSMGLNAFSDLTTEEFKQRNGHGAHKKEDDDATKALKQAWEEWKTEHKRQYETPAEEARRFALFQETKKRIDEHNEKFAKGEVTYSMGLNAFSDLTPEEVKMRFGRGVLPRRDQH